MQLGLQNYAFIMSIENSCMELNNKKVVYTGMTLHRFIELCTKWYSTCTNITTTLCTTAIFKISVKTIIQMKLLCMPMIFHLTKLKFV
jgi:hypothetical protein